MGAYMQSTDIVCSLYRSVENYYDQLLASYCRLSVCLWRCAMWGSGLAWGWKLYHPVIRTACTSYSLLHTQHTAKTEPLKFPPLELPWAAWSHGHGYSRRGIFGVEALSHARDGYSYSFSSNGHQFGGHGPLPPSGSATVREPLSRCSYRLVDYNSGIISVKCRPPLSSIGLAGMRFTGRCSLFWWHRSKLITNLTLVVTKRKRRANKGSISTQYVKRLRPWCLSDQHNLCAGMLFPVSDIRIAQVNTEMVK